jgi:hypothetical protein
LAVLLWIFTLKVVKIIINIVWWPLSSVLSGIKSVLANRKLRQSIRTVRKLADMEVVGDLKHDEDGFYLSVPSAFGALKVRVSSEALLKMMLSGKTVESEGGRESKIATSIAEKSAWPKSLVVFRSGTTTLGYGVRVKVGGVDGVLSAKHVFEGCKKNAKVTIGAEDLEAPVDYNWKVGAYAKGLDVIFMQVPSVVLTGLNRRVAKLGYLPSATTGLTTYGSSLGEPVMFEGTMGKTEGLHFTHNCSTIVGSSGTPIYSEGFVVGIHVRGHAGFNSGVAVEWMLPGRESVSERHALRRDEIADELEVEIHEAWIMGRGMKIRTRHRAYEFSDYLDAPLPKNWADMGEDEYEYDYDFDGGKGTEETLPSKSKMTGFCSASENTSLPTGLNAEAMCFVPALKKRKNNRRKAKKGSKAVGVSSTPVSSGSGQRQCAQGEEELKEKLLEVGGPMHSLNLGYGVGPQMDYGTSWAPSPPMQTIIELVEDPVDGHLTRPSSSLSALEGMEHLNILAYVYQPGRLNVQMRVELARVFGFHLSKRARFDHITVAERAYLDREHPERSAEWEMRGRAACAQPAFDKQLTSQRRR